ncbi:hypothetical protein AALP_AA5G217600 [Arabis alpina]|uniref:Transcription factor TFIIB cyclin-like domain-containing protein n=1 Tax=Arabis alpina TaxID=50452 RepID=A0A087GYM0_ARAAL|nr:hypothetical protein AALP_AA5G217600 [Arabis alpina]
MLDWVDCCRSSKSKAWVVIDHAAKTSSCSECGFDFGYYSIEDVTVKIEEDVSDKIDTVRFGDSSNSLRNNNGVFINTTELNNASFDDLFSFRNRNSLKLDSGLISIEAMCDRLGVFETVKNQAYEIFKKVEYKSRVKNRNAFFAACIYVACRQNDMTWSIWEIFSVANGATRSDINKAIGVIAKTLKIDKNWLMRTKAAGFINRFCSRLEMGSQAVKAAQEAAKSSECVGGSSPLSVAAAVIYVIAELSDQKKTLKGIVEATGVTVNTIRKTYMHLYPHLSKIVPKWFAEAKDMEKLCIPRQRTRKI